QIYWDIINAIHLKGTIAAGYGGLP
ncbi:MAG: hypothetical protein EZS28_032609, partial [Streblomastix strix]